MVKISQSNNEQSPSLKWDKKNQIVLIIKIIIVKKELKKQVKEMIIVQNQLQKIAKFQPN